MAPLIDNKKHRVCAILFTTFFSFFAAMMAIRSRGLQDALPAYFLGYFIGNFLGLFGISFLIARLVSFLRSNKKNKKKADISYTTFWICLIILSINHIFQSADRLHTQRKVDQKVNSEINTFINKLSID